MRSFPKQDTQWHQNHETRGLVCIVLQGSGRGVGFVVATMAHMSHGLQRFPPVEAKQWKVGVLQQQAVICLMWRCCPC